MALIVQKYGGSSVADLDRLRQVAKRIAGTRAAGHQVVAVVSAMGNTTNELIGLARALSDQPDRRELDMLISVGERVSMALLAMALRELGVPARSLTGSQSGIITDEAHADARVVEVRPARLRACLAGGEVAIVAGFQGVSRAREVTTLGRGGSDTTAVVLAAALQAEVCEICSDVDGVWSADPRLVPEAVRRDELSLSEALALSRGGARVLFEDAVRYARDHGVSLRATTTFGPGAGTRITPSTPAPRVVAITGDPDLVELRWVEGLGERLLATGARVRRQHRDLLHVDLRNAHGALDDVPQRPIAVVTAVGSGLGERIDEVARGTAALVQASVEPTMWGASGDQAWWEVARGQLDAAVRLLHHHLC